MSNYGIGFDLSQKWLQKSTVNERAADGLFLIDTDCPPICHLYRSKKCDQKNNG